MNRRQLLEENHNSIFFTLFIAVLWSKQILLSYVTAALKKLPIPEVIADALVPAMLFILFLLSYQTITERLRGEDFVFVFAILIIYALSYSMFLGIRAYYADYAKNFLTTILPFYFVGVVIRGEEEGPLVRYLYILSVLSIIAFFCYMFFVHEMTVRFIRGGDMDSAYRLLPHICLIFYRAVDTRKPLGILLFILGTVCLMLLGTRGAVLCLLIFILLTFAVNEKMHKPLLFLFLGFVVLLLLAFPEILNSFFDWVYELGQRFGMSTRIFDKAKSGELITSTGRISLITKIKYYLEKQPFIGLGIYGDRFVTNGQYVHNLFFELWAHFGYVIGSFVLILIASLTVSAAMYAVRSCSENTKILALVLVAYCLKLLVSSSYLAEPLFWLTVGYFTALRREKNHLRREDLKQLQNKRLTEGKRPTIRRISTR